MARIADVAQRAGVSTATVSRVLNGIAVREDLAALVRAAAADLNYTPDRTARSLRKRHSHLLALIVPDIANPFFTLVARGVEDIAREAGYAVVICNTDETPRQESRYLQIAEDENMAGIIIAPVAADVGLDRLLQQGRAVVVIDQDVQLPVDMVTFDNRLLGQQATDDLIAQGYRRIACVTGPATAPSAVERATGWRVALTEAGLAAADELLQHAPCNVEGGIAATTALASLAPIDAVLVTNNLLAAGVLEALAEHDPSGSIGVSVIGELPPSLAKMRNVAITPLSPYRMGLVAASMLLERIDGLQAPPRAVNLPLSAPPAATELPESADAAHQRVHELLRQLETLGADRIRDERAHIASRQSGQTTPALLNCDRPQTTDELLNVLAMRQVLEVGFLPAVVSAIGDHPLRTLRGLVERMAARAAEGVSFAAEDRLFHQTLYAPLHNPSLLSLIGRFWDLFANLDERDFRHTESAADTVQHHVNILDAIEHRDVTLAQFHMNAHFYDVVKIVKESWQPPQTL
ncbi:MAG: FCD domain-containing protein [Caldilineaceae bacterium]